MVWLVFHGLVVQCMTGISVLYDNGTENPWVCLFRIYVADTYEAG